MADAQAAARRERRKLAAGNASFLIEQFRAGQTMTLRDIQTHLWWKGPEGADTGASSGSSELDAGPDRPATASSQHPQHWAEPSLLAAASAETDPASGPLHSPVGRSRILEARRLSTGKGAVRVDERISVQTTPAGPAFMSDDERDQQFAAAEPATRHDQPHSPSSAFRGLFDASRRFPPGATGTSSPPLSPSKRVRADVFPDSIWEEDSIRSQFLSDAELGDHEDEVGSIRLSPPKPGSPRSRRQPSPSLVSPTSSSHLRPASSLEDYLKPFPPKQHWKMPSQQQAPGHAASSRTTTTDLEVDEEEEPAASSLSHPRSDDVLRGTIFEQWNPGTASSAELDEMVEHTRQRLFGPMPAARSKCFMASDDGIQHLEDRRPPDVPATSKMLQLHAASAASAAGGVSGDAAAVLESADRIAERVRQILSQRNIDLAAFSPSMSRATMMMAAEPAPSVASPPPVHAASLLADRFPKPSPVLLATTPVSLPSTGTGSSSSSNGGAVTVSGLSLARPPSLAGVLAVAAPPPRPPLHAHSAVPTFPVSPPPPPLPPPTLPLAMLETVRSHSPPAGVEWQIDTLISEVCLSNVLSEHVLRGNIDSVYHYPDAACRQGMADDASGDGGHVTLSATPAQAISPGFPQNRAGGGGSDGGHGPIRMDDVHDSATDAATGSHQHLPQVQVPEDNDPLVAADPVVQVLMHRIQALQSQISKLSNKR